MPRSDEFKGGSSNPAKYFLEWKSDEKCFSYYDKEKSENKLVKLPFKFLVLKQMNAVKGWHDKSGSGIFSNEVSKISEEPITVKSFKGGKIAEGYYKDIKQTIKDAGGHYVRSIYIMTEKGEMLNLQLKGAAVKGWGDFTEKAFKRLEDEWVSVVDALEDKKGSIKFSIPVFQFSGSLTKDQGAKADEQYETLVDYLKHGKAAVAEPTLAEVAEDDSDLPF